MQLKTILNQCYKFKCFVYDKVCFVFHNGEKCLEIDVVPRRNRKTICSCCDQPAPLYDRMKKERRFEFIPLWGYRVFLVYLMRRVDCTRCGVKVEQVPWARGKRELTDTYQQFLAHWGKKLSWKEVAVSFRTSWEKVFQAVEYIVEWGLEHRDLSGVTAIGVDEIAWRKGHNYLTMVYQIDADNTRLLWIGKERTIKTLLRFFRFFGKGRSQELKYVCSDMWCPYIKVIKKKAGQALHILDRFHIVAKLNKAIDEVRAGEHRQMQKDGYEPVLKNSRWCLLKRWENLTEKQDKTLTRLCNYRLKTARAYLLKLALQDVYFATSREDAEGRLKSWYSWAIRSQIDQVRKVAKTVKNHWNGILAWFDSGLSNGFIEAINGLIQSAKRRARGYRSTKNLINMAYLIAGKLDFRLPT